MDLYQYIVIANSLTGKELSSLELLNLRFMLAKISSRWPSNDGGDKIFDRIAGPNLGNAMIEYDYFPPGFWRILVGGTLHNIDLLSGPQVATMLGWGNYFASETDILSQREIPVTIEAVVATKRMEAAGKDRPFEAIDCDAMAEIAAFLEAREPSSAFAFLSLAMVRNVVEIPGYLPAQAKIETWQDRAVLLSSIALKTRQEIPCAVAAIVEAIISIELLDRDAIAPDVALRSCEVAVERLRVLDAGPRKGLTPALLERLGRRELTSGLAGYFLQDFRGNPRLEAVRAAIGGEDFPLRITRVGDEAHLASLGQLRALWQFEFDLDTAYYRLEDKAPEPASIEFGWHSWRFFHPVFRRCVPAGRSLLLERSFDRAILDLAHETTHALSMLGGVGLAMCAYRIAAYNADISLWIASEGENFSAERLAGTAWLPPLKLGDAACLMLAPSLLAPIRNTMILQDTWLAWMEGIALFAESASNPIDDRHTINDTYLILKNLISDDIDGEDEADLLANFEAMQAEFESKVSDAISRNGSENLRKAFTPKDWPYLPGYLVVRAIVAQWRKTTGEALPGSACLQLLNHATRFLTLQTLPKLDAMGDDFSVAAKSSHLQFLRILMELPGEDILAFVEPSEGRPFRWKDGRLLLRFNDPVIEQDINDVMRRPLEEAHLLCSKSVAALTAHCNGRYGQAAIEALASGFDEFWLEPRRFDRSLTMLDDVFRRLAILPIGSSRGRFQLNIPPTGDQARATVTLRTSEDHFESGGGSMRTAVIPLEHDVAEEIAEHHKASGQVAFDVARIIDLGGFGRAAGALPFAQAFWFKYGTWQHIAGLSRLSDAFLREVVDFDRFKSDVGSRLAPNDFQRYQEGLVANGSIIAKDIGEWIGRSQGWDLLGTVLDLGPVSNAVAALADELATPEDRRERQLTVSAAALKLVFGTSEWFQNLRQQGFNAVTSGMDRTAILQAMASTGRVPGPAAAFDEYAEDLAARGLPIFTKTDLGWDIGR